MRIQFGQVKVLALTIITLILLSGIANLVNGEVRFRRTFVNDPILDPTRFTPAYGLSSIAWDSSASDTLIAVDSLKTFLADSIIVDSLSINDVVTEPLPEENLPDASGTTTGSSGAVVPFDEEVEFFDEEIEEDVEDTPYHPTLIYNRSLAIKFDAAFDTSTGYVTFSQKLDGIELPVMGAIDPETYLSRSILRTDRESWRTSVIKKMPKEVGKSGGGINITIPVFRSKTARRIFGGSNIGLTVNGNISISGNFKVDKKSQVGTEDPDRTNYNFKVDQTQSFVIKGKVGEKVSVDINQDSERLFDFENNLSIRYKGSEDEILQSFEAGNLSLSLGNAGLVSGSSRHKGLFGFKTQSQIGALRLTTIASLDKGEKKTETIRGGGKEQRKKISPKDFIEWKYFFVDTTYRTQARHRGGDLLPALIYSDEKKILDIRVYKSVKVEAGGERNYVPGWAFTDSLDYYRDKLRAGEEIQETQEHQFANFLPLEITQFNYENYGGWIRLETPLRDEEILAVAYITPEGTYGVMNPQDEPFVLKLLKPNSPDPSDRTWDLSWKNVYSLQAFNVNLDDFEGRMYLTGANRDDERVEQFDDGENIVEVFGLDFFDSEGQRNPDGLIDKVFIRPAEGELWFPDLTPFDPEGWFIDRSPFDKTFSDELRSPEIYLTRTQRDDEPDEFQIETKYTAVSTTYSLDFNVLEGSVEVFLNGARLNAGTDYTVNYISGELSLRHREATDPDAEIEIKYEKSQLFQLDTKSLLGIRAEYDLWEKSTFGATLMYMNQKTVDRRVRVGGEPMRNSIWGMDFSMQFEPYFFTRAADWLPLIETDDPSTFTISGEVAQVFPNPNSLNSPSTGDNNGVAYIDDFESIKRITPLGITRKQWTLASYPNYDNRIDPAWSQMRGRIIWYNPRDQVKIKDASASFEIERQLGQDIRDAREKQEKAKIETLAA